MSCKRDVSSQESRDVLLRDASSNRSCFCSVCLFWFAAPRMILRLVLCRNGMHKAAKAIRLYRNVRDQTCAFRCLRDAGKAKDTTSFYGFGAPDGLFLVAWCTYVAQKAEKALNSFRAINYLFREMPSATSAKRKRSRNENKKTAKEETQRV